MERAHIFMAMGIPPWGFLPGVFCWIGLCVQLIGVAGLIYELKRI